MLRETGHPNYPGITFLETPGDVYRGIGLSARLSQRRFIVYPGVDNCSVSPAEPEEPESSEKFGAPPMTICRSNGIDPNAAGKTININGQPFSIVGVAPMGFIGTTLFQFIPDVWVPVMMQKAIAPAYGNRLEAAAIGGSFCVDG